MLSLLHVDTEEGGTLRLYLRVDILLGKSTYFPPLETYRYSLA